MQLHCKYTVIELYCKDKCVLLYIQYICSAAYLQSLNSTHNYRKYTLQKRNNIHQSTHIPWSVLLRAPEKVFDNQLWDNNDEFPVKPKILNIIPSKYAENPNGNEHSSFTLLKIIQLFLAENQQFQLVEVLVFSYPRNKS